MEQDYLENPVTAEQHSLVPPSWDGTVRAIKKEESEAAGLSLALSFADDHLSHYLMEGRDMECFSNEARWKLHVALMTTVVVSHARRGIVTTIGADHDALAIWYAQNRLGKFYANETHRAPPGSNTEGWWTAVRSGIIKLYCQLSPEGRKRYFKEMLPLLTKTKAAVMQERDDDCYYLVYIGTKPNARAKGYATKLLRNMIRKVRNNVYSCKSGHRYSPGGLVGVSSATPHLPLSFPRPASSLI